MGDWRDPDHATFKGDFVLRTLGLYSLPVPNLATLTSAVPEIWLVLTEI